MHSRAALRRGADLLQHKSLSPVTRHTNLLSRSQTHSSQRPSAFLRTAVSPYLKAPFSSFPSSWHDGTNTRPPFACKVSSYANTSYRAHSVETSVTTRLCDDKNRHGRLRGFSLSPKPWGRQKLQLRPLDRRRYLSSGPFDNNSEKASSKGIAESAKASAEAAAKATGLSASPKQTKGRLSQMPPIPHIHRPTKEELLAAATGFWSRLKVRFKWFSIRSVRPFNVDEISGFLSWLLVGHVLWIVLGTTTFFSLAIWAINTVFAQGWLTS